MFANNERMVGSMLGQMALMEIVYDTCVALRVIREEVTAKEMLYDEVSAVIDVGDVCVLIGIHANCAHCLPINRIQRSNIYHVCDITLVIIETIQH